MRNENKLDTALLTRRHVLSGGLAGGLAGLALHELSASGGAINAYDKRRADLYVFPRAMASRTVVAVTWPADFRFRDSNVRIHAGPRCWNVNIREGESIEWDKGGCRTFAGRILSDAQVHGRALNAIVMEVPSWTISESGSAGIWAERFTHRQPRHRIGSPVLSEIIARNAPLAALYHSTSPAEDPITLTKSVAEAIAFQARASNQIHSPEVYGRRLASILLPDIVRYDPRLPTGFTFAAQNGRHPEDDSDLVVHAMLGGSSALAARTLPRLKKTFPYFTPLTSAA